MPQVDVIKYVTHLSLLLETHFNKLYKEHQLSNTDVRILLGIKDEEGLNQEYFVKETLLSKNIVSQRIKKLVEKGLVCLQEDLYDKRNNVLALTKKGFEQAEFFLKERLKINNLLLKNLPDFNIRSLSVDLPVIIKNAEILK